MEKIILSVKGLCAGYRNRRILDGIDLDIQRGKVYSIIGPNGCGKTTLIRAMSRNLRPERGEVFLDGSDIFRTNTKLVARKMAVLGQSDSGMSDITVRTLVEYGRYAHKKWWAGSDKEDTRVVDWAIERTGMSQLQNRKINALSGGERQRARIAMAIAQKPEIMLLDEPTTYLDIAHQLEIMELVSTLNREEGITVVMVLHDMNHAVRYSDELVLLDDKKIYTTGRPNELLENRELEKVFGVDAEILTDSEDNSPIFYAKRVRR
ncbi:MAG: ABC transporter ATP-binding protein [Ruminiclostridium sp.]|uniref:ABC transporter ATP-binding protein n=1 Tax=Ruminococcus sp. TaxID=41978 RepID=UPI0025ED9F76|nr:ABC transporter ATP-binding protein [Ruminococcus sp.]MBR1432549.1 ABC transporter ATP-binding protein [Ruminococcus sp.]MBR1832635.1 ABC transporter ATP-binding protein [Ruminiclostridium sp.]